ncbi:uncharacterized protein LOC129913424 isoform X2 [Episyrphus balteatus]|uniref:uncharacterized protein LOC129913424 isoform X2 n=1 Tax=Episyrphus balteatus TaxID=286459 RepID=UPI00248569B9|nr:uncharacterized protein LOC129913424 isoform X2 [Episyrphus balteatus]XP_055848068.1 uncharacterized protein LOC129913424 isoform X2 [Episyrphus balteatus]
MDRNRLKKKKQRAKRELTGDWPDDKVRELIYNVEIRPELWDVGTFNHRIPKPQTWQEVAAQLGKEYDWRDCRLKWQNLRVTYKCNLIKIAKKQAETGIDNEVPRVLWRFFHLMEFITKKRKHHHQQHNMSDCASNFNEAESDCTMSLDPELTNASCSTMTSQQHVDFIQCPSSTIKQEVAETPPPLIANTFMKTPSPPPIIGNTFMKTPSHLNNVSRKEMNNTNDEYACFGNFIASELRSLPPEHSFALKRRLNRTLLEYWDEIYKWRI